MRSLVLFILIYRFRVYNWQDLLYELQKKIISSSMFIHFILCDQILGFKNHAAHIHY